MEITRLLSSAGGVLALLCLASGVAQAHHSFAMFDRGKTVTLVGTVRSISWTNPHTFVWVYVPNAQGGQDTWAIEFSAGPVMLARDGWTKDTLKAGDRVTLEVNPLKDGRTGGMLMRALLSDGRVLNENIDPPPGVLEAEPASSPPPP